MKVKEADRTSRRTTERALTTRERVNFQPEESPVVCDCRICSGREPVRFVPASEWQGGNEDDGE